MPGVMTGTPLMAGESLTALEAQLNSLTGELQRLRTENAALEGEVTQLQAQHAQQATARRISLASQIAETQRAIATEQQRKVSLQAARSGLVSPGVSTVGLTGQARLV